MPTKGSRRLDADDPRYAGLPVVAMNGATGDIEVVRGPFTPASGFAAARGWLADRPGHPHVVFTTRRGDVRVWPVGSFVDADARNDPRATSSWMLATLRECTTLAQVASLLRDAADEVEALAADGWWLDHAADSDLVLRDTRFLA
jgi:hypothetical protein